MNTEKILDDAEARGRLLIRGWQDLADAFDLSVPQFKTHIQKCARLAKIIRHDGTKPIALVSKIRAYVGESPSAAKFIR